MIELMRSHRSIRKFKPDPIPDEMVEEIIGAAQWASSSHFGQIYSVITVKDQETKHELWRLCSEQKWIEECPLFLVFCADMNRAEEICKQYDQRVNLDYLETFLTAVLDVGLLMQNVALAAESIGLGIVMIGGLRNYPREIVRLFNLPKGVFGVCGMCLGYPAKKSRQRPRLPIDEILHREVYNPERRLDRLAIYDGVIKAAGFYKHADGSPRGWTERIAGYSSKPPASGDRMRLKSVLKEQGFGLK